jgi:alanyl-tRNA synthetase
LETERLYYNDPYLSTFTAQVVGISDDGCQVVLDRTAFYPTSGGQPNDLGILDGKSVLDVIDRNEEVVHVLEAPVTASSAEGRIDWPRRYDHMQQHTGQHLLSAVFMDLFGFETLSFRLGGEVSTIELGTKELSEEQIHSVEERASLIVAEARPVTIHYEDASSARGLRKPSSRAGMLRIIDIADLDRSACGGTHVRSTAEIGQIQIRRCEKVRGNIRIEFVCGRRALIRAQHDFRMLADLASGGGVPVDKLPEYFASLRQRLSDTEKDCQRYALELARREMQQRYESMPPSDDGLRRIWLEVPLIDDIARAKAQEFTSRGRAIACLVGTEANGLLISVSADSGLHAGNVLKAVIAPSGGRGGGSGTLAQGSLPDKKALELLARSLGFV